MGVHLGEIGVAAGASSHPAAAAGADARPAAAAGAAAHPTAEDAAQVDAREHARIRRREREHCCQFLGSIFMFFVFMNLMMTHLAVTHVFWLERTVIARLSDVPFGDHSLKFADVHDYDTFWEWVELALEPALVEQFDAVGNALPHNEWGYIARYNKVIGGVRMYQDRGRNKVCKRDEMHEFYGMCYPENTQDHDDFGLPACETAADLVHCEEEAGRRGSHRRRLGGGARAQRRRASVANADDDYDAAHNVTNCYCASHYAGTVDLLHDEGFEEDKVTKHFEMWLDLMEPEATIQSRIEYLEERHWCAREHEARERARARAVLFRPLSRRTDAARPPRTPRRIDKQTENLTIAMLLYNGQKESAMILCEAILTFRFDRAGYIENTITVESTQAYPYQELPTEKHLLETLFLVLLLSVIVEEVNEIREEKRSNGGNLGAALSKMYLSDVETFLFQMVDLTIIVTSIVLMAYWGIFVEDLSDTMTQLENLRRPDGLATYDDNDNDHWSEFHHEVAEIEEDTAHIIHDLRVIKEIGAFYVFALIARFYKTWTGIPALNTFARTIEVAFFKLLSFLFLATCLLAMYGGAGVVLFGQQMAEFATFEHALRYTASIVLTGEADIYDQQSMIDKTFAAIWFWSLILILFFVLLNTALAILVDAYDVAQKELKSGPKTPLLQVFRHTMEYYIHYALAIVLWKPLPGPGPASGATSSAAGEPLVAETKAEEQVELPVTWVPKDSAPVLEAAA